VFEWIERILGMDTDKRNDPALEVIATALTSMAHSFSIIALNFNQGGITPEQTALIEKVTADLKVSHDKLQAAVDANAIGANATPPATPGT
jgi:hypothetical protein